MIIINVSFSAKATKREPFVALLETLQTASAAEAGCLRYCFSIDLTDPLTFHLVEMWQDDVSLLAHVKSPHFLNFIRQLADLSTVISSKALQGDMSPYTVPR